MKKEALLIIDLLNDFVREGAPLEVPDARMIVPVIQREIDRARASGKPVIYVCDSHEPDDREFSKFGWPAHAVKDTKGADIIEELRPIPADTIIRKRAYSAFFETDMDETLRRLDVSSLRLTGVVTHICILFTAADAVLRDYSVSVVEDGVADLSREDHNAALRFMESVLRVRIE